MAIELSSLPKQNTIKEELIRLYLGCIGQALDVYGAGVKSVVFWKFEKMSGVSRNEIYLYPEQFIDTIRSIFGAGVSSIEKAMIREIKESSGISYIDPSSLPIALRQLRSYFSAKVNETL